MRQQPGLAALLASALLLGLPAVTRADASDRGSLAEQARTVLRRHCLRCHGDRAHGGVRLLEQPLNGPGRSLVVPEAPDRSLLLDLVEGGSMPPGALPKVPPTDRGVLREWIRAGADAFPPETGRDYLLRLLAADFRKLPEPSKPYARYLSLDHLGPDKAKRQAVAAVLRAVFRHLSPEGKPPIEPVAVEPTGRLLRMDLRQGGWDRKPFKNESLNLFDLLLLEYPYGVLPGGKLPADLTAFLRQTRQVRPILYVRGDWLARVAVREPLLHPDLLVTLGKPECSPPPREAMKPMPNETLGFEDAVRELETSPDVRLLQGVVRAIPPLAPLARKETVKRAVWERYYLEVVRRLGSGLPILPLDGLTWPNHDPDPELKVRFRLIVPGSGPPNDPPAKSRFTSKDRYSLWIHSNKDVTIEVVYTDSGSNSILVGKKIYPVLAGQPLIFAGRDGKGFRVLANVAEKDVQESFTLYACPTDAFVGGVYPAGKVIQGKNIADRFLHPLYELNEKGDGVKSSDAGKMVKITVPVTFAKP